MKLQEIKDLIKVNEDGTVNVDDVAKSLHTQLNGFINAKVKQMESEKSEIQEQLLSLQSEVEQIPQLQSALSDKEKSLSALELKTKFQEKWFGGQDDALQDAMDLYLVRSGKEDVNVDELFESIASKYAPKAPEPVKVESQATVPSVETSTAVVDENDFSSLYETLDKTILV